MTGILKPQEEPGIETCLKSIEEIPGIKYHIYGKCDSLMDKLELLNYHELLEDMKIPPFHRLYFATQKNPGEQFFIFTQLAAWLVRRSGCYFPAPTETQDPNGIIAKILDAVQDHKSTKTIYSSKQLKSGYGEEVVEILKILVDRALSVFKLDFEPPILKNDGDNYNESYEDEDAEIVIEEEPGLAFLVEDEDDDAGYFVLKNEKSGTRPNTGIPTSQDSAPQRLAGRPLTSRPVTVRPSTAKLATNKLISISSSSQILPGNMIPTMQNKIDLYSWKSECESIDAKLANSSGEGPTPWESKFKNLETLTQKCARVYKDLSAHLKTNLEVAERDMKEIESKESIVQNNYFPLIKKLIEVQNDVETQKKELNEARKEMGQKQEALEAVTDQVKDVSRLIEERANYYTDRNPILGIKKDTLAMVKEIKDMDVQIGIFEMTILKHHVQVEEDYNSKVWNIGKKLIKMTK